MTSMLKEVKRKDRQTDLKRDIQENTGIYRKKQMDILELKIYFWNLSLDQYNSNLDTVEEKMNWTVKQHKYWNTRKEKEF